MKIFTRSGFSKKLAMLFAQLSMCRATVIRFIHNDDDGFMVCVTDCVVPVLAFIGMAMAPRTVPSITWKIGKLRPLPERRAVCGRVRGSELFPLTARGVEPGGGR